MRTLGLTAIGTVTLNSSGNGTAQVGPSHTNEVWNPTSVSISSAGTPAAGSGTTCFLYAGVVVSQWGFVDSTYNTAGAASSLISGQTLYPGQYVFAVFTNAGAGATATMVVQ
jgi:hypothetical protein